MRTESEIVKAEKLSPKMVEELTYSADMFRNPDGTPCYDHTLYYDRRTGPALESRGLVISTPYARLTRKGARIAAEIIEYRDMLQSSIDAAVKAVQS